MTDHFSRSKSRLGLLLPALSLLAACGQPPFDETPPGPGAIRLVDVFPSAIVDNTPAAADETAYRSQWRFDEPAADAQDWRAGSGVAGLEVRDGRLRGRSTTELPILHVERTTGLDDSDLLHAVELRLRVSQGANLCVGFVEEKTLDFDRVLDYARSEPCPMTVPIVPADRSRTFTVASPFPVASSGIRHLLLQPTDAAGAEFEIEWVRLVFRKEHLAGLRSGISWQGLAAIYRETLVTRAPETVRFALRLPARPWLDLTLATLEEGPVTFRVGVTRARGGGGETPTVLLERTLTRSGRWESAPVELAEFAGEAVTLSLSLTAADDGALGFWGAPVVRNRVPAATGAGAGRETPQGVILIVADTLRSDHLDAYGYPRPTAPVLSRLAAEGVLFRDCIAQASWTKVSMASILSSLYPTTHGVALPEDRLPSSARTLAEVYRDAGYATLSLSSIFFNGRSTNLHQGFEEFHEADSLADHQPSKTSREYMDRLLPWLETHREVPFFVLLHVFDPHDPFRPYRPYDTRWTEVSDLEAHRQERRRTVQLMEDRLHNLARPLREELLAADVDPEAFVRTELALYDGSIRAMDAEIGRLVERLKELGLDESTLVAFTSDHGEEFLEHGRHFHGQSVYGELLRVPLVLWWPGVLPAGRVIDETVETLDLMPSLLDLSRLPLDAQLQGRSLVPLVTAAEGEAPVAWRPRPAIAEKAATDSTTHPVYAPPPRETESFAIIAGGWKLIHNRKRSAGRPEYELYDHRDDPLNLSDLASEHPEVVEKLVRQLDAWHQQALSRRLDPDAETADSLSREELERLRSLGYIR